MDRSELKEALDHIDNLVRDLNRIAPISNTSNIDLRGELSGLLLVAICAIYENVIKQIMIEYADSIHVDFSYYIEENYKKLNSKISKNDLCSYLKLFSSKKEQDFKIELTRIQTRLGGMHPNDKYTSLLQWRHSYAHSKVPQTTIEEAYEHHRYSKLIIYAFNKILS